MSKTLLCLGIAWLFCCGLAAAEPLVVFPSGDFSCSVKVTPRHAIKPDPSHPERRYAPAMEKIVITRIGKLRRDITTWSDGSVTQLWDLLDKALCVQVSNHPTKDLYVLQGDARDTASPKLSHFDADSVSWITEKSLDKTSPGGVSLHYQAKIPLPVESGPPQYVLYQAWIDPKSHVPLVFDDGDASYALTFSPTAPVGPLVLPNNVQAELNRWLSETEPHAHL